MAFHQGGAIYLVDDTHVGSAATLSFDRATLDIPRLRCQRQLSILGAVLLLIYCTALLPPTNTVANLGLVGLLPRDSGVSTDAIVVPSRQLALTK